MISIENYRKILWTLKQNLFYFRWKILSQNLAAVAARAVDLVVGLAHEGAQILETVMTVSKKYFLTSLDISDVDPVWTWGDKRSPHKKTEKTRDFEKKLVTEIW